MGAFPSGQWGQTVNLLLNASVVRIHQLPPKRTRNLGCGFFFVLELVGFEQVGRPQTAKNSPADCFLDRGLRIHQLPPKSCGKNIAAAFFLWCTAQNQQSRSPIFKVRFIEMSNRLRAVGFFVARFFCCFQNVRFPRSRRPWSGSCPSRKIRNRAQNCSGHLQSGRKTGIIATVTCLSSSAG